MGSSSGIAGLKCLQWVFRGIQFVASVIIMGVYAYYLATMTKAGIEAPTNVKAVLGIATIGTIYTAVGVLLVCCCAGHAGTSFIAMIFDIGLSGAYIYVAVANRDGASSCSSGQINTVYGSGDAQSTPSGAGDNVIGNVGMPTYHMACTLEMACLVAASVAVLFFLLSVFMEIHMNRSRHRAQRPIRDADGEYINKSDHIGAPPQRRDGKRGFLGGFRGRRAADAGSPIDPDMLPVHQQPAEMQTRQVAEWGEVSSLHDSDRLYFNDGDDRDEHGPPVRMTSTTAPRPAADAYNEGEVDQSKLDLYQGAEPGKDLSKNPQEIGKRHETRAARAERYVEA